MSERFHDLTKVPKQPAAKLLARAGMKLQVPIDAPASALPEVVLSELAAKAEWIELLKLLAVLLVFCLVVYVVFSEAALAFLTFGMMLAWKYWTMYLCHKNASSLSN